MDDAATAMQYVLQLKKESLKRYPQRSRFARKKNIGKRTGRVIKIGGINDISGLFDSSDESSSNFDESPGPSGIVNRRTTTLPNSLNSDKVTRPEPPALSSTGTSEDYESKNKSAKIKIVVEKQKKTDSDHASYAQIELSSDDSTDNKEIGKSKSRGAKQSVQKSSQKVIKANNKQESDYEVSQECRNGPQDSDHSSLNESEKENTVIHCKIPRSRLYSESSASDTPSFENLKLNTESARKKNPDKENPHVTACSKYQNTNRLSNENNINTERSLQDWLNTANSRSYYDVQQQAVHANVYVSPKAGRLKENKHKVTNQKTKKVQSSYSSRLENGAVDNSKEVIESTVIKDTTKIIPPQTRKADNSIDSSVQSHSKLSNCSTVHSRQDVQITSANMTGIYDQKPAENDILLPTVGNTVQENPFEQVQTSSANTTKSAKETTKKLIQKTKAASSSYNKRRKMTSDEKRRLKACKMEKARKDNLEKDFKEAFDLPKTLEIVIPDNQDTGLRRSKRIRTRPLKGGERPVYGDEGELVGIRRKKELVPINRKRPGILRIATNDMQQTTTSLEAFSK